MKPFWKWLVDNNEWVDDIFCWDSETEKYPGIQI